jgi:tellurite resistance protein TerC
MSSETLMMGGFLLMIIAMLMIDLLVVGRNAHVVKPREALIWTGIWVSMALLFYLFLLFFGHLLHGISSIEELQAVTKNYFPGLHFKATDLDGMLREYRQNLSVVYLSGYFIEETLSIDNIFVILMILRSFAVPLRDYKTVLFWGILGAIILRFVFIFAGAALIHRFDWILLIFGAFLVYQGLKIIWEKDEHKKDPHDNPIVRFLSSHVNITTGYEDGDRFWFHKDNKLWFTPLMLVLVLIEFTDLLFAMDSIPAVFSVSLDPYIVFFSNIFAIIGLRSMFFLLADMIDRFRLLKYGVSILLGFVGVKLLFHTWLDSIGFKPVYSLVFIFVVIAGSILLSLLVKPKKK